MGKLKRFALLLRGFFPSKLPTKGMQELDDFTSSIFETYNLPDLPSYRQAVASMIMHLGPITAHKPKFFFAQSIRKAASNQLAYEKIQQLKKQEQEYIDKTITLDSESKVSESKG